MEDRAIIEFLKTVESLNLKFASIKLDSQVTPLTHSFWSEAEIERGRELKIEWGVAEPLIPFYGNWHELICLDTHNNSVIFLNDSREVIHKWYSIKDFLSSLSTQELTSAKQPTLKSYSLSDELKEKAKEFLNKST